MTRHARCPECGATIDVGDAEVFRRHRVRSVEKPRTVDICTGSGWLIELEDLVRAEVTT